MSKNCIVAQSGGPTAAINASLAGVVAAARDFGIYDKIYGAIHGIQGVLKKHFLDLSDKDDAFIQKLARTPAMYLGSCRFKLPDMKDDVSMYEEIFSIFEEMNIGAFFYIGGNDSMDTVAKLSAYAASIGNDIRIIGVPKTIDNDLWGTDMTFGFQSAVDIATEAIDRIHTTATSHSRVFIVEVMGHKVGWVTLHAGIAGGADIILLPEIPYDVDNVVRAIKSRTEAGKHFTIIAVAEGAITKEDAALPKKKLKEKQEKKGYPSVAYELAEKIQNRMDQEVRITVPGHTQRGGSPCPYDRVLATRLGAAAADLILKEDYGYMVGIKNGNIRKVPLGEVAGKLKMVDPKADIIKEAKIVGISFGDE